MSMIKPCNMAVPSPARLARRRASTPSHPAQSTCACYDPDPRRVEEEMIMTEPQSFAEDCLALLDEKLGRVTVDRRGVLKLLAALGATATLPAGVREASAQAKQIVFVNWGGI